MDLDEIWSSYRQRIKAFLFTKISNSADVDDLLQEILIKTHHNLANINSEDSIKSWLFQIANRTIIDFYRKNARVNGINATDLWQHEHEQHVNVTLSSCIEPFFAALPEKEAALLRAIDLNGISQKAYAQQLQIPYSTLKSQVQQAREHLRALFERCCHYQFDKNGNLIDFEQKSTGCKKC